jgi:integrase
MGPTLECASAALVLRRTSGVLEGRHGRGAHMEAFVSPRLGPQPARPSGRVLEKELEWKGFHAGRRGLGTVLRALTGNATAVSDVLGHKDEALTKDYYGGRLPEVALAG